MHAGSKLKAARELGISRCYLHRLLNQLKVSDEQTDEDYQETVKPRLVAKDEELRLGTRVA
jgi:hypothetical protein